MGFILRTLVSGFFLTRFIDCKLNEVEEGEEYLETEDEEQQRLPDLIVNFGDKWKVEQKEWGGSSHSSPRRPHIAKNPPVWGLKAFQNFNELDYFRKVTQTQPILSQVIESKRPDLIYWEEEKALHWDQMEGKGGWEWRHRKTEKVDIKFDDFLKSCENQKDGRWHYWISNENKGNIPSWMKENLFDPNLMKATLGFETEAHYQIWMGEPGLVSLFHYDASYNYFCQITGYKKITIAPPSEATKMQLYPWIHSGDAHTQIDPNNVDELFIDFHSANTTTFILAPGDVLLIPPYWLHQVISLDLEQVPKEIRLPSRHSIVSSISFITPSEEEILMKEMEKIPFPLDSTWAADKKRRVLAIVLSKFLRSLQTSKKQTKQDVFDLLHSRFRRWKVAKVEIPSHFLKSCKFYKSDDEELKVQVAHAANASSQIFLKMTDEAIRRILAWNFVESIASLATNNNAPDVPRFIQKLHDLCFQ